MADRVLVEDRVRLRDGRKWKYRRAILRRPSPAADTALVELRRENGGNTVCVWGIGAWEAGFLLDGEHHTLALLARDATVLAFETRERLQRWTRALTAAVGDNTQHAVRWNGNVARLHVAGAKLALVSGLPPRLHGMWEIRHLRRYGVADGAFCWEGGAACGRGAGPHAVQPDGLTSLRALQDDVQRAAAQALPTTRLTDIDSMKSSDTLSKHGKTRCPLQRCVSCMSALGTTTSFTPAWTMPSELYDVPRTSPELRLEHYDTPKRIGQTLEQDLLKVTRSSTFDASVLKKNGCLLNLGRSKNQPAVIDSEENVRQSAWPCRRVTDWASGWICRRNTEPDKENREPLYATVDFSRKTRRRPDSGTSFDGDLDRPNCYRKTFEITEEPSSQYENLDFARSLKHYENGKELLRKVEEPKELMNISTVSSEDRACSRCGHSSPKTIRVFRSHSIEANSDYLMMEPSGREASICRRNNPPPAGYTPMSPIGPSAFPSRSTTHPALRTVPRRIRSHSADCSRFLEELEELSGSGETLCGAPPAVRTDSTSSNDSGVSSCGARGRRCRSADILATVEAEREGAEYKSSSAEAVVPVLTTRHLTGEATSSACSEISDGAESLSLSSHNSDPPPSASASNRRSSTVPCACVRRSSSTLRPRSGGEYCPRPTPPSPC